MSILHESLNEFMADTAKFQSATPYNKTWKSCWIDALHFDGKQCVVVEGGVTCTMENNFAAIVNVTVSPVDMKNGAEDLAAEQITIFIDESFDDEAKAMETIKSLRGKFGYKETNEGTTDLSTQLPAATIAPEYRKEDIQ
jgi:hypothetical protein